MKEEKKRRATETERGSKGRGKGGAEDIRL